MENILASEDLLRPLPIGGHHLEGRATSGAYGDADGEVSVDIWEKVGLEEVHITQKSLKKRV